MRGGNGRRPARERARNRDREGAREGGRERGREVWMLRETEELRAITFMRAVLSRHSELAIPAVSKRAVSESAVSGSAVS